MQYELSDQEVQHIEKYRALSSASQGAVDLFMERVAAFQAELDRAETERKSAAKS